MRRRLRLWRLKMRQAHNITLILPEGVTLMGVFEMLNRGLKNSDVSWITSTDDDALKIHLSDYHFEDIIGSDFAIEFKKRDL